MSCCFTKRTTVVYLYNMRLDKEKAFELRKQGKTYKEIIEIIHISPSTLSDWFKNQEWSKHITKSNTEKHIIRSTEHLHKMNAGRRIMLEEKYKKVEEDAEKEFEIHKNDSLFMAGLMVYAGEGDKTNRHNIRLSNSEFYLHLVFIRFCEKFLKVERKNIKIWLLLYPDHNIEESIAVWSKKLNINKSNFHKSQVIIGKERVKKLQYGVGNSIISNTSLKKKMLKWLELCKLYFN